jgi:tetratricopeptide (TPR) repeat protein
MIIVIAVVVLALQAGGVSSRHGTGHHVSTPQPRSTSVVAKAPQSTPGPTPSTPVSPALATQFEAQGHDLLQSGQYGEAVPVLRRALAATGKQLSDCVEPVSETCLTYAYALYDLGRALELNGEPSAALPVLEQRLQIDNQRDVVAAELARVRTSAQQ